MRSPTFAAATLIALLSVLAAAPSATAQTVLRGTVTDAETGEPLPSATVQVADTYQGTITNAQGRYALEVDSLPATVVVRFIGYETARRLVAPADPRTQDFTLAPSSVGMGEVVVTGEDFAENVMRKVIERKQAWWDSLRSYRVAAYSRYTIANDTGIVAIAESQSDAFYRRGEGTREVVRSRRRTANFDVDAIPAAGSIENLYADDVPLFGHELVGITHPDAVDRYAFTLDSVRARDGQRVYDIRVEPDRRTMVGFRGQISVLDSAYAVIDARLEPSRAVRFPPGLDLRDVEIRQQFAQFDGPFWLPVDYQARFELKVSLGALLEVPAIRLRQVSRLTGYAVNAATPDSLFDAGATVRVDSAAVARLDSLGAGSLRADTTALEGTVALSEDEQEAYATIDSTQTLDKAFEPTGPLASLAEAGDGAGGPSTPDWLALTPQLWFNRVEGGRLGGGVGVDLGRLRLEGRSAYATAAPEPYDWTYGASAELSLGADAAWTLAATYDREVRPRYTTNAFRDEVSGWARFENTVIALTADGDNYDYYGTERWRGRLTGRIDALDVLVTLQVTGEDIDPVAKQTDYDLFASDERLRPNALVPEAQLRSVGGRVTWGDAPEPFSADPAYRVSLAAEHADPDLLASDADFTRLSLAAQARLPTFFQRRLRPNTLAVHVEGGTFAGDALPLVRSHVVGGYDASGLSELKTLNERPYEGEQTLGVFWEHRFRTVPFEWLGLQGIADRGLGISLHGGHARSWFGGAREAGFDDPNRFLRDSGGWHHEVGGALTGVAGVFAIRATARLDAPGFALSLSTADLF